MAAYMDIASRFGAVLISAVIVAVIQVNSADVTKANEARPPARAQESLAAGAPDGTCRKKYTSPAVIETVTEHRLIQPQRLNTDGSIKEPAVYRSLSRQKIVTPRQQSWFQIPCPDQITPELVASLQRALAARGFYLSIVTGRLDRVTGDAIRRFQKAGGLDSATLSLKTARKLGLIAYPRPQQ